MTNHQRTFLGLAIEIVVIGLGLLGCRGPDPRVDWPAVPAREVPQAGGTLLGYDISGDDRLDYLQRIRNGYKDQLHFADKDGGRGWTVVERGPDSPRRPLVVLLLDGVSYDRIRSLYDRGRFRLLRPPTRIISTLPSLTDVAYDAFFGTGPTPGFEAEYFDRAANRMSAGVDVYLAGENERWIGHVDYRISLLRDALMYLMPQSTYEVELRAARRVLDRELKAGRREVVLYFLSTDGLGHMLPVERLEERLAQLDDWIERAVHDWRGELDVVVLADHGNTTVTPRRFDVHGALQAGGFRIEDRLTRAGDIAVPLFGLLDLVRVHTFDAETRERVVAWFRGRQEVELVAWRDGEKVQVWTEAGTAQIESRGDGTRRRYRAASTEGDPLGLAAARDRLAARGELDGDGFATAAAWVAATETDTFPAAPPRIWEGLFTWSTERPDVIVSLHEEWFVGKGFFSALATLRGTHGGLSRRASETFIMAARFELPVTLLLTDLSEALRQRCGWPVRTDVQQAESAVDSPKLSPDSPDRAGQLR